MNTLSKEGLMSKAPFERLRLASAAYQQSCVLEAAAEHDICTLILERGNRLTAKEAADLGGNDPRAVTFLLDTLAAMEYLVKQGQGDGATYAVAEAYKTYLDSRHPDSYVPLLRHLANVHRNWVRLSWTVRDGRPPEPVDSILGPDQDNVSFILGMNSIARVLAEPTAAALKQAGVFDFKKDIRFLDIGGASGTYTQAFLQALPGSRGAIFDLPVGIAAARQRFTGTDLEGRVELFEGDFYRDALPQGFDFAWISAIIHQMDRTASRALYAKAFQSLHPGGRVAVRDFIMNNSRTSPLDGAFFGINMLVNTQRGMVYTYDEVKEDLEAAGFTSVKLTVPAETMSAVVTANRPQGSRVPA